MQTRITKEFPLIALLDPLVVPAVHQADGILARHSSRFLSCDETSAEGSRLHSVGSTSSFRYETG